MISDRILKDLRSDFGPICLDDFWLDFKVWSRKASVCYKRDAWKRKNNFRCTPLKFSLYMFNTCLHLEALFSKPKTVQNRQQNHVRLVETLSYARRTLTSAQNAPKMRQDGPDERFGSFLTAKMTPQNAPKSKKTPLKKQSKNTVQKPCWKIILS